MGKKHLQKNGAELTRCSYAEEKIRPVPITLLKPDPNGPKILTWGTQTSRRKHRNIEINYIAMNILTNILNKILGIYINWNTFQLHMEIQISRRLKQSWK